MKITVTEDHLKRGVKGSPSKNPIALAVQELLNKDGDRGYRATVSYQGLLKIFDVLEWRTVYEQSLDAEAVNWLRNWTVNWTAKPFESEILEA